MLPGVFVVVVLMCIAAVSVVPPPRSRASVPPGGPTVQARAVRPACTTRILNVPTAQPTWRTSAKRRLEPYVRHIFVRGSASMVTVPVHLKNVTGVELWKAWVPRGEHALHKHNNTLSVTVEVPCAGGEPVPTAYTVRVDEGEWCAQTLAVELQRLVRATCVHCTAFTAHVNPRRGRMCFTNTEPFSLRGSMVHALGFADTTATAREHEGSARIDLAGVRYIDIRTSELGRDHSDGVLAQVALSPGLPIVHYTGECTHYRGFQRPLHLTTLTVGFTACDPSSGKRPYMFNGMCWSLTLVVHGVRWRLPWSAVVDTPC